MSVYHLAKRCHCNRKRTFFDTQYPELTTNMMGQSTKPNMTKGKQLIVSFDDSDTEPEGVFQHTHTQTGTIAPVDYIVLVQGIEVSEAQSAIAKLQASNSSVEKEAF